MRGVKNDAGRLNNARLKVGDRVRLKAGVKGPMCRTGAVFEDCPQNGGVRVRHDKADDMGLFGMQRIFGWMYYEVELDPEYME